MLVNCAGTSMSGKFEELEVSSFEVSHSGIKMMSSILKQPCQAKNSATNVLQH
jgi:hypothetical protein